MGLQERAPQAHMVWDGGEYVACRCSNERDCETEVLDIAPAVDPAIRAEAGARATRLALGLPDPAPEYGSAGSTPDLSDADHGFDTCDGTDHECSHDVPADWEPAFIPTPDEVRDYYARHPEELETAETMDRYVGLTDQQRYEAYERDREWSHLRETDAYQDAAIDAHFETLTPEEAETERARLILSGNADPLVGRGPVEDAPRYAWTVEGEVTSGTLDQYREHYLAAYYGDLTVGDHLWDGERTRPVHVYHQGTDSLDYMHYTLCIRECGETGRITDWTYVRIDGRA